MHQRPLPPRLKRFCDSFGKRLCPEEACPPYTISVQTGERYTWDEWHALRQCCLDITPTNYLWKYMKKDYHAATKKPTS